MSSIQKVRTYVYDTPATYNQFNGGINTNLSNEALELNELRDGLNCHYVNQSLVNRKGEKIIKKLILPVNSRPQGDFLFSGEHNDYIISVRNGHIFYGIYEPTTFEIPMKLLLVDIPTVTQRDDPRNYLIDIQTKTEVNLTEDTEGFIYVIDSGGESSGNESEDTPTDIVPDKTLIVQNTKRVQGIPVKMTIEDLDGDGKKEEHVYFIMATGLRILRIAEENFNNSGSYILKGHVMEAYTPNSWEMSNTGVNNFSPFPNYLLDETVNVPQTSIGQIFTEPKQLAVNNISSNIVVTAKVNTMLGYQKEDFYYKWEARIGASSEWKVIWFWKADLNPGNATSKGKTSITITPQMLAKLKPGQSPVIEGDVLYLRCTCIDTFQVNYDLPTKTYSKDLGEDELDIDGNVQNDFVADESQGQYTKTHIERKILNSYSPATAIPDAQFLRVHSCTKLVSDGSKILFYDDAYDSCEWYKTVVGLRITWW